MPERSISITKRLKTTFYTAGKHITGWGLTAVLAVATTGSVFCLFARAFSLLVIGDLPAIPRVSLPLFMRSIWINAGATALCVLLGILSALFLWVYCSKARREVFYWFLFCAVIPPFIHVHSWIQALDKINSLIEQLSGLYFNFTGVGAVALTMAFSYLPFTGALCYMGLLGIPPEITDLLRIESGGKGLFFKGIFPYITPYIGVSALFVFLININEYAISSVFGVNVYALELFALFSAGGDIYAIAVTSVPLILVSILLMLLISSVTKKTDFTGQVSWNTSPFRPRSATGRFILTGGIVLLAYTGIPIVTLFAESFAAEGLWRILSESLPQIGYSFLTGGLTAAGTVCISFVYVCRVRFSRMKPSGWIGVFTVPFMIPSAVLGLSMIAFWNHPALSIIYMSPFMPAIGLFARYLILPLLYFLQRFKRLDSGLIDELRLHVPFMKGMTRVLFPMMRRDMTALGLLVFALTVSEYSIVHLLTPPGYQMLTIKIYNYLHYGASEVVHALNLTVLLTILLAGTGILLLYGRKHRENNGKSKEYQE